MTDNIINTRVAGWYGRQPGVVIRVMKQPDANVVQTVDGSTRHIKQTTVRLVARSEVGQIAGR